MPKLNMKRISSLAVVVVILLWFGEGVAAQSPGGTDLDTLTAEVSELRSRIAALEAQADASDKFLATRGDVVAAESNLKVEIAGVRSDVERLRTWLIVGLVLLAVWNKLDVLQWLQSILRTAS